MVNTKNGKNGKNGKYANIPKEISKLYPFRSYYFTLPDGHRMHYLDENESGSDDVILMLHGNPTWSFFFRVLIRRLRSTKRIIVPDYLGMGLSDKPLNYEYTLENHIKNIQALKEHLGFGTFSMILHDWGGAIGMGVATANPHWIEKMVIMNSAAYRSKDIPFRLVLGKIPFIGEFLIRRINAFTKGALRTASVKKLPKDIRQAYLYPYKDYKSRVALARFVQDIPLNPKHPSYKTLKDIEEKLHKVTAPKLILWGEKDFCFHTGFLSKWLEFYPTATSKIYPQAGHYLLEDAPNQISHDVQEFLT